MPNEEPLGALVSPSASIQEVLACLADALGESIACLAVGSPTGEVLAKWASGDVVPPSQVEVRARATLDAVRTLAVKEGRGTIRAWFIGSNPYLSDRSPAITLSIEPSRVLGAARNFVAGIP